MRKKEWEAYHAVIDEDALDFLADVANGDARAALKCGGTGNPHHTNEVQDGMIHITLDVASGMYPEAGGAI